MLGKKNDKVKCKNIKKVLVFLNFKNALFWYGHEAPNLKEWVCEDGGVRRTFLQGGALHGGLGGVAK